MGGISTESLVTEYSGLWAGKEVTSRELPPLLHPRYQHACGWYTVGDSHVRLLTHNIHQCTTLQILLVTGGFYRDFLDRPSTLHRLATTLEKYIY